MLAWLSSFVGASMALLALLVAGLLVAGHARAHGTTPRSARIFGAVVTAWLAVVAMAALSGLLRRDELRPPPLGIVVLLGFAMAVTAGLSRVGARVARGLPLAALIGFHAFRLPLELVMHRAANEGLMPVQMSFSGSNFDILSGITAIVVAALVAIEKAPRWLLYGWAITSSALLGAIVAIAIASTPLVGAFGRTPERLNTWVGWFPFCWLPAVLVPAALFGQIVVFRRLAADRR